MRSTACLVCFVSLLLSAAHSCFSAQPKQLPHSVLADVAALDKRVTYTELKIPLGELVQKVATDTGAPLTAARDVADEPVAVVVKEMPARELLEQLGDLLDYRWSLRAGVQAIGRSGVQDRSVSSPSQDTTRTAERPNGRTPELPVRYEIWQDLPSKQREEALRQAAARDVEKRFQEELKLYVEMAALTPEQLQEIQKMPLPPANALQKLSLEERRISVQGFLNSPEGRERMRRMLLARTLAAPLQRALTKTVGGLTAEQWKTLRNGQSITFSTDPQPGEPRLSAEMERIFRSTKPTLDRGPVRSSDAAAEERIQRQERIIQEQWAAATGYQVSVSFDGDPSRTLGNIVLRAETRPIRTGAPGPSAGSLGFFAGSSTRLGIYAWAQDPRQGVLENSPERTAELDKDPVMGVKQLFQLRSQQLLEPFRGSRESGLQARHLLPELARTYHVQFLADAYTSAWRVTSFPIPLSATATALFTQLDRYTGRSHRWDRQGNLIRLRSRTWFQDRPREIPLRLVRGWQEQQGQLGALTLDTYAAIASTLTEMQLDGLQMSRDDEFAGLNVDQVPYARYALRLYATLSATQRRQLQQGGVLPVTQMTSTQRSLFLASLREEQRSRPEPMRLEQWTGGSFSLARQRFIRIVEKTGSTTRSRMEALDAPAGSPGAGAAASPGAPAVEGIAGAAQRPLVPGAAPPQSVTPSRSGAPAPGPTNVSRFPVTQLELRLQYGPEQRGGMILTVAGPS